MIAAQSLAPSFEVPVIMSRRQLPCATEGTSTPLKIVLREWYRSKKVVTLGRLMWSTHLRSPI